MSAVCLHFKTFYKYFLLLHLCISGKSGHYAEIREPYDHSYRLVVKKSIFFVHFPILKYV